jgi:hypothetical protein
VVVSNIIPFNDIQQMATVAAKTRMFGFKSPEEAMAIMLLCQAEGLHPGIAMRDYHVIQGRPTLKADAMLARFQQAGGKVEWHKLTDQEVSATFSHAQGGSATISWTFEAAKKIGLTGKDNWNKYPRAMLRARVVSEGVRTVYPGVVIGTYTPEEAQDMDSKYKPEVLPPVEEETGEQWPLMIPGSSEPYQVLGSAGAWVEAYKDMASRIKSSAKLSEPDRNSKLVDLLKFNKQVFDGLNTEQQQEVMAL